MIKISNAPPWAARKTTRKQKTIDLIFELSRPRPGNPEILPRQVFPSFIKNGGPPQTDDEGRQKQKKAKKKRQKQTIHKTKKK